MKYECSSGRRKRTTRASYVLALLSVTALGLAASPTALAEEGGGQGTPIVQTPDRNAVLPVIRKSLLRYVSWSD